MAAANLYRGALCVGGLGVATFFVGNVEKADSECETKGHPWPDLPGGGIAGALTKTGLLQTFQLGTELRRRYVDERTTTPGTAVGHQYLLPARWSNDTSGQLVHVRSTKTRRTLESARGVLSGLYPQAASDPDNRMKVDVLLNGEPEYMVAYPGSCARMLQLRAHSDNLFVKALREPNRRGPGAPFADVDLSAVISTIEGAKGWMAKDPKWKAITYRDEYACRKAANLPVPACVEDVAIALNRGAAQQMRMEWEGVGDADIAASREGVAAGHERLRLSIGRMLGLIAERLQRPDGRLHMYSAHDFTVAPLLLCVARHDDPELSIWAPFCSNISFELWSEAEDLNAEYSPKPSQPRRRIQHWPSTGPKSDTSDTFVRVIFNGHVVDMECAKDGSGLCRLADFLSMVQPLCVEDYRRECKALPNPSEAEDTQ